MNIRFGIVLVLLMMFTAGAMAVEPTITITPNKVWIVANGADSDLVTVTIYNGTIPMNGSVVTFSVDDPIFGYFSPPFSAIPTVNGGASVLFRANTKSGNATISANVRYRMNDTAPEENKTVQIIQRIDHDTPYKISSYLLQSDGTVGTVSPILVWVQDIHNNPVDNKREVYEGRVPERVIFSITGQPEPLPAAPGNFIPEGAIIVTRYVNGSGMVNASVLLSTIPGFHNVMATAMFPTNVSRKWTIESVADGEPWYIDCQVFPYAEPNPYLPADGESKFTLIYTLYDRYMNGLQAKTIDLSTDLGQFFTFATNATGKQIFTYGPSSEVAMVDLTVTSRDNLSVSRTDTVEFVNTTASDMIFTATPLSLPSADVPPSPPRISTLSAHVMDSEGNPVAGQLVEFTIPSESITYGGAYSAIYPPCLKISTTDTANASTVSATTDSYGIATVYLKPCVFNTNKTDTGGATPYSPSSTGYCSVVASWTDPNGIIVHRYLDFIFKNYPYLSAKTTLSQSKIQVNGTVDVTLYLSGDGFSLLPTPIDTMLVCDRSGSMGTRDMEDLQGNANAWTRWRAEKEAANLFIGKMNSSTDRLGLVRYESSTSLDKNLQSNFIQISNIINSTSVGSYTSTRNALKKAIEAMNAYPNSNSQAIRAIILMSDGEFNYYGDPLARGKGYDSTHRDTSNKYYDWTSTSTTHHTYFNGLGGLLKVDNANINTNQNMTLYAKNSGLRIYTISLSDDITDGSVTWETMDNLADNTGGHHYHATSTAELTNVYTQIAGELKNKAGVDTHSSLNFNEVEVKNVTVPGAEAFKYVPLNGVSTHVENWNQTGYHEYWVDQTNIWDTLHTLSFSAGTIYIGDYWKVTFRLQALLDGDIHIFDPSSVITFNNDGAQTMSLPDTVINVIPDATNETGSAGEFTETDVNVTHSGPFNTTYTWQWNRHYTGDQEVSEFFFISFDGGQQWTLIGGKTLSPGDARNQTVGSFIYDIRNLLPMDIILAGITVDFKLKAYAEDAPSPRIPRSPPIIRNMIEDVKYITLQ